MPPRRSTNSTIHFVLLVRCCDSDVGLGLMQRVDFQYLWGGVRVLLPGHVRLPLWSLLPDPARRAYIYEPLPLRNAFHHHHSIAVLLSVLKHFSSDFPLLHLCTFEAISSRPYSLPISHISCSTSGSSELIEPVNMSSTAQLTSQERPVAEEKRSVTHSSRSSSEGVQDAGKEQAWPKGWRPIMAIIAGFFMMFNSWYAYLIT